MKCALVLLAALAVAVAGCRSKSDRNGTDRNGVDRNGNGVSVEKVKDPVCGMTCDRNENFKVTHQGRDYYFCHQECMKRFQESPSKYTPNDRYPTDPNRTP